MNAAAPVHYDVIIAGAGSVGVPTAFALANAGIRTLVLDGRSQPRPGLEQGCDRGRAGDPLRPGEDPA